MAQGRSSVDSLDNRPPPLRTLSNSSEITTKSINSPVPHANPLPAYIAQKAASDLIATELDEKVLVSESALVLVNEFLDQVLYNILSASRSTSLRVLKNAVPNVLKPRLGKAALRVAEEELKEYLDDEEVVDLQTKNGIMDLKNDFDTDLVWKIARLRCMVYTRLGDLEEEDEQEWLQKERLLEQHSAVKSTSQAEMEMGPATAIFLTSIVEYLGEQALYFAAQHAQKRHYQSKGQFTQDSEGIPTSTILQADEIIIDGKDMNHVGRDSPLSRLWRSWRRNTRDPGSGPISPDALASSRAIPLSHSRNSSATPLVDSIAEVHLPADIPLPMSVTDIDEIEVPGLAPAFSDDEAEDSSDGSGLGRRRPSSMNNVSKPFFHDLLSNEPPEIPERSPLRSTWTRKRSLSSPVPALGKRQTSKDLIAKRNEVSARIYAQVSGGHTTDTDGWQYPSTNREPISPGKEQVLPESLPNSFATTNASVVPVSNTLISTREATDASAFDMNHDVLVSTVPKPKKTVAEEILGSQALVAPPQDAQTGASITNVSDFDSMHIPVATPTGSPDALPVQKGANYFQNLPKGIEDYESAPTETGLGIRPEEIRDNLKSAPLQTNSGRISSSEQGIRDIEGRSSVLSNHDVVTMPYTNSGRPDVESPVSVIAVPEAKLQDPGSVGPGAVSSFVPPREILSNNVQNAHANNVSHFSTNSPHLQSLSNSNRVPATTGDVSVRSLGVPKQRVVGDLTEEEKLHPPVSDPNTVRDIRPGTSNSSLSKRLNGKQYPFGEENDEAKKKSLEILIRSNETLHYTLTPAAAMRDEQSLAQRNRMQNQDAADQTRGIRSPVPEPKPRVQTSALSSNPVDTPSSPTNLITPTQRKVTPSSPKGGVQASSPSRSKNPLGEPRDARTHSASGTRDLADYARSTGPLDANQLPQSLGARPSTAASSHRVVTPVRADTVSKSTDSPTSSRTSNRLKYQARDARPARNNDAMDLIDFIREGPPGSGREHRIDRRVAPFRTTMDSEDFNALANRPHEENAKFKDSNSSTREGDAISSLNPSVNTQTPLMAPAEHSTNGKIKPAPSGSTLADSDGMPKRTRRRIKDPYAIYDSDDDDSYTEGAGKNQEESLIDFLRNTAPPSSGTAQPVLTTRPGQRTADPSSNSSARETSPHLTQVGTKMDKYRPTQPTHAAHVERNRVKPRYEARDAKATRANTAELAEYLKNSGPAPNTQYKPQPFILSSTPAVRTQSKSPSKEESPKSRWFSRRKK